MRVMTLALWSAAAFMGGPALAQPIATEAARDLVFDTREAELVLNPNAPLTNAETSALRTLVSTNGFKYYGAMAYAPDEGLVSESLQGAFNFHDVQSASAAALTACNAARAAGSGPCVVAAQIVPRRWKPSDFQLSQDATVGLATMAEIDGEKAMAVSATSGSFGIGQGNSAEADALTECNRNAPQRDCIVAVKN